MGHLSREFARHLRGLTLLVLLPMAAVSQQPHQHGVLELNLALEERVLLVEMTWPLGDLAGFEHWPPRDDIEQDGYDRGVAVVTDPRSVFSIPTEAKCKIKDVETEAPQPTDSVDSGAAEATDEEAEPHANPIVSYRFKCKSPDDLSEIRLHIFRLFPDLQLVEANLITETAQTFQGLTFADAVLRLPR